MNTVATPPAASRSSESLRANQPQEDMNEIIDWLDMSMYGVYLGIIKMPGEDRRSLVMIDERGDNERFARALGFKRSQLAGVWFNESLRFTVPGEMKRAYPQMQRVRISRAQRWKTFTQKLVETKARVKQQEGGVRPGWRPDQKVLSPAVAPVAAPLSVAINQTLYCGLNAMGQEVFEISDGTRYLRANDKVIAREEGAVRGGPEFLRARSMGDVASLTSIAHGLVNEMQRTKLRSADFARYLNAALGQGSSDEESRIIAFQHALDAAIFDRLARQADELGEEEAFALARALHEMRPPFFRPEGSYPTPAPISAVLQSIMIARTRAALEAGESVSVLDVSAGEVPQHGWMMSGVELRTVSAQDVRTGHDFLVGGIFGHQVLENEIEGLLVRRADHMAILESLAHRSDTGLTLLTLSADDEAGILSADSKRLIAWLGERFEIVGLVDLDPSLIGEGVTSASRILGVGKKREERLHGFAVPAKIPVLFDYDELFSWAKDLIGEDFRSIESFGEKRQANRLQSPYIPHSQISEPASMSPRNLLGPTRKALSRLVDEEGLNVDEFVMRKLSLDAQVLASGILNAEQIDAIALGIRAIDENRAFVVADQAGLGKGRVLAALAAYAVKSGRKAMFMTEKSELFADFYRDVRDIGMQTVLDRPFLMNTSGGVNGMDGESVLFPASSQADVLEVCRRGNAPSDQPFMLATYSIFNREAADLKDFETMTKVEEAVDAILTGSAFDSIPHGLELMRLGSSESSYRRKLRDETGAPLKGEDLHVKLNTIATYKPEDHPIDQRAYSHDDVEYARRELRMRKLKPKQLAREIEREHKKPLNAWRAYWAHHTDALSDVILLLDESHNAAGLNSNTGDNIRAMTAKAAASIFSSATFAKDEKNLPLYARIFPGSVSPEEITRIVSNGGEPLREILTGMLAEDGLMIRREHDMGSITFKSVPDLKSQDLNRSRKDAVAHVLLRMAELAGAIKTMVSTQNAANKSASKPFTYSYSGPFSRFYAISRAFSVAIGAEHCADLAIEALNNNKKPVLTIESTMESIIKDMAEMAGASEDEEGRVMLGRNLSFKDLMRRYAENMFNVYEVTRNGRKIVSKKKVAMAPPGMEAKVQAIYDMIDKLPGNIPISPIDAMRERIESAGFSFGEVSGRKIRLSTDASGNQYVEKIADTGKGASIRTVSSFNAGETDVLMLSRSGNSGISAQSSALFADTRQRTLIEAQPASDIRERVQFFGRVFRTGQVCPPEYVLPSSGLSHDRRLTMIQNTSSRKMSASVSGNSDNMMIDETAPEIMNHVGNEVCYNWLENRPDIAALMNITLFESDDSVSEGVDSDEADINDEEAGQSMSGAANLFCGTEFVDKLTGRLFMLPSDEEERAWNEIHAEYRALIEQYEADGYNPLKSSEYDIRAKKISSMIFESAQNVANIDSVFNRPVVATLVEYKENLRAVDVNAVVQEINENREKFIEEVGNDGMKTWVNRVLHESESKMKALARSLNFKTVFEALSANSNNRVKNMKKRMEGLVGALREIREPGNVVYVGDDRHIVMNITPPKDRSQFLIPSMWTVRLLNEKSRVIRDFRLSSVSARLADSFYHLEDSLKKVSTAQSRLETRVLLEGNLFGASQVCERMKRGEPVSYSDERGVWHQAFMMPEGMNMSDVMAMDIQVRDPKLAHDLMYASGHTVTLTNSFDAKSRVYAVVRSQKEEDGHDDGALLVNFTKTSSKAKSSVKKIFMRDEILKRLSVEGKTVGAAGIRQFRFAPENASAALERIIALGESTAQPLMAPSRMREWIEDRRLKLIAEIDNSRRASAGLAADLGL